MTGGDKPRISYSANRSGFAFEIRAQMSVRGTSRNRVRGTSRNRVKKKPISVQFGRKLLLLIATMSPLIFVPI